MNGLRVRVWRRSILGARFACIFGGLGVCGAGGLFGLLFENGTGFAWKSGVFGDCAGVVGVSVG